MFALTFGAERFSTKADVPLVGDVDLARILVDIPADYSLKGMFFTRYVDEAWPFVEKELLEPPPNGKYHAFEAYPMSDYIRVFDRIARARFPGSTREAYRLLARGEVEVFAETTLGKVTFSMLRDPEVALVRYPELFGVLSKGPEVTAERIGPNCVAISFARHVGSTEHVIGLLEGLAMEFDVLPSVHVDIDDTRRAVFTLAW
jgi:uncharacterized protein (TIGR02265 family)